MHRHYLVVFLSVLAGFLLLTLGAPRFARAADGGQGKALVQEHCIRCHGTDIFHPDKKIDSLQALQRQVTHCNKATHAGLNQAEEAAIVDYLNGTFYHFH
jgi:mono/diheme cytochrome c family protein